MQQQGILSEIELKNSILNHQIAKAIKVFTPLATKKLERALHETLIRHKSLRSTFHLRKGKWYYKTSDIRKGVFISANFVGEINTYFNKIASTLFDLKNGPLFKLYHIHHLSDEYIFICAHHLVVDLWSIGVFLEDLFTIYKQEFITNQVIDYQEFVIDQKCALRSATLSEAIEYWNSLSKSFISDLGKINGDLQDTKFKPSKMDILPFDIPSPLVDQVYSLTDKNRIRPVSLFITVFSYMLFLCSSITKTCFSTTSHGRNKKKYLKTIGLFSSPIPLFCEIDLTEPFIDYAKRVQKQLILSLKRYSLPFPILSKQLTFFSQHSPLSIFENMFVFQQVPSVTGELKKLSLPTNEQNKIHWKGFELASSNWNHPFSSYNFTMYINEIDKGFNGFIEYDRQLFSYDKISSLLHSYLSILDFFSVRFKSKPMDFTGKNCGKSLSQKEKTRTFVKRFAAVVKRNPCKIVGYESDRSISFGLLDSLSNQYARYLLSLQILANSIVALHIDYTTDMLIALVGAWKLGCTIVPIDITTNTDRKQEVLSKSNPVYEIEHIPIKKLQSFSKKPLNISPSSRSIAYIIYTSGSTGKPKGVAITHDALFSYLYAINAQYQFKQDVHFAAYSSISFDLSLTSLCYPLLFGHSIHFYSRKEEVGDIFQRIIHNPILTHLKCTPSHLKVFQSLNTSLSSLQTFIVGGEQLASDLTHQIFGCFHSIQEIINEYGPTETTIGCVAHIIDKSNQHLGDIVPIGKPLSNSKVYLLGPSYADVTDVNNSELYIGGDGLAIGYWDEPELTAEKFIPHPYAPGKRLYRSGDLCSRDIKSIYTFSGRTDNQIKIRGHRIEIGEIESKIKLCPYVKDTVVLNQVTSRKQSSRLVAYCILKKGKNLSSIRKYAQDILPVYMLPAQFVECENFPLTKHGKIDTTLLERQNRSNASDGISTLSSIEAVIQTMCAEILDIPKDSISLDHTFFEIGGNSINAIQLIAMLKSRGWEITVKELLSGLNIREITKRCSYSLANDHHIKPHNVKEIPLTPMQSWFFNAVQGNLNHYNQAIILRSYNYSDHTKVHAALKGIEARFPLLKSTFPDKTKAKLLIDNTLNIAEYAIENSREEKVEIASISDAMMKSMDIASGPLFLVSYIRAPSGDCLIFTAHHLVIDAISWHLILQTFDEYYNQQFNSTIKLKNVVNLNRYSKHFSQSDYDFSHCLSEYWYRVSDQIHSSFSIPSSDFPIGFLEYDNHKIELLVLTAFTYILRNLNIGESIIIHVEEHGRKNLDNIADLTGWFTLIKSLNIVEEMQDIDSIKRVIQHQLLQENLPFIQSNILFNFLGKINSQRYSNFSYSPIWSNLVDQQNKIPYSLIINVFIEDKKLKFFLSFDKKIYTSKVVESTISSLKNLLYDHNFLAIYPDCPEKLSRNIGYADWMEINQNALSKLGIIPTDLENISLLFPSQKGMYQYAMQYSASANYHQQLFLKFSGYVTESQIECAYKATLMKFPGLRTFYLHENLSEPHRLVCKEIPTDFSIINSDITKYIIRDQKRLFNVNKPPLIRLGYQGDRSKNRFYLVLTYHHLIMDGWGLSNFFKHFMASLEKSLFHRDTTVQPIPPLVPDNPSPTVSHKQYWSNLLRNFNYPSDLPKTILKYKDMPSIKILTTAFPKATLYSLQRIINQAGITLSSLLHAFWSYLVSCYSGKQDVIFGTVLSGRSNTSNNTITQSIDQLTMTIPIRCKIQNRMTFIELSQVIQKQILESEQSCSLSTGEILSTSHLNQKVFDHIFVMENYPFSGKAQQLVDRYNLPFKLEKCSINESSHYPFSISFVPGKKLHLEIQYDPTTYHAWFIENIATDLEFIFKQFIENQDISVNEIFSEYIDNQHRALPLVQNCSFIKNFSDQVKYKSKHIALTYGNHQVSFEHLDKISSKLATFLVSHGLKQEDLVGIKMSKSIEWVIIWLGILKAGGAYVPIDSNTPIDRLNTISTRYSLKYLFTDHDHNGILCSNIFQWDDIVKHITTLPTTPLPLPLYNQLAYVIFTSGSTGIPKGIAMHHGAISSHFQWMRDFFKLSEMDRMLQLTAVTFDVSVCELYAMAAGATLVIPDFGEHISTSDLLGCIDTNQITFLQMVPPLLETLLESNFDNQMSSVRQLLCGADIMKPEDLSRWNQKYCIPLTNLYGLTEACIDSTYFCCNSLDSPLKVVPIGHPIQNTFIHVLGENYNILPKSAIGFLFIEGQGVGRGYYNNPQKTAEEFVPSLKLKGSRMFSTHDKAYRHDNSNIVFLGRSDNQVKIRGLRVELDEIRLAIMQCSGIKEAIVQVIKQGSQPVLCCYYTAKSEISHEHIRVTLSSKIPAYMIPNTFVHMQKFPLNSHGKIDSTKLSIPKFENNHDHELNNIERTIIKIWSRHLGVTNQTLHPKRNFFELGGNSLIMMQIHQDINQIFSINLPITRLFEYPTVDSLAKLISGQSEQNQNIQDAQTRYQKRKSRENLRRQRK